MNIFCAIGVLLLFEACSRDLSTPDDFSENTIHKLNVVASTSIVFDVVKQVGGDVINLDVLLPIGTDPHSFEPTPQDLIKLSHADAFFINGAGLEKFLNPIIESSGGDFLIVDLSSEIQLIGVEQPSEINDDHDTDGFDPHVWMDPNNVIIWAKHIVDALTNLDTVNSSIYETNAQLYIDELIELDRWIIDQVKEIPFEQRKLLTDHLVFGYFANKYGFKQVGAVLPSFSSQSQPSAQEIASLEDVIRNEEIKAMFVGVSVNPNLARRMAEDTGIRLVYVHTGSLTEKGGTAENYIDFIRYDVNAIVTALR
jgi:ABC-type Zn uptake system ZnuABC Zn-binding protein ZnuA